MAEPEDLLGKADALMTRHRPTRPASDRFAEIPVLEEVVGLPPRISDPPVLTEQVAFEQLPGLAGQAPFEQPPVLTELVESDDRQSAQSEVLALSLRASLLAASQPEVDDMVEERLKERLEPLVEKLFFDLRSELQLIARDKLSEAINSAVEREIERRKSDR